jgi:hypothetical protein
MKISVIKPNGETHRRPWPQRVVNLRHLNPRTWIDDKTIVRKRYSKE